MSFNGQAVNDSATFVIGKGSEWKIDTVTYGYIGSNSIAVTKSAINAGDYLHVNTVIVF